MRKILAGLGFSIMMAACGGQVVTGGPAAPSSTPVASNEAGIGGEITCYTNCPKPCRFNCPPAITAGVTHMFSVEADLSAEEEQKVELQMEAELDAERAALGLTTTQNR